MMNTRMKLATAVAALGLTCAWTAQADESNCSEGTYTDPETEQAEPVTKGGDDSKEGMDTTTSGDFEMLAPTTRYFDFEVHDGKTKMSYRIKERGTLKFKNKSPDKILRDQVGCQASTVRRSGQFEAPVGVHCRPEVEPERGHRRSLRPRRLFYVLVADRRINRGRSHRDHRAALTACLSAAAS